MRKITAERPETLDGVSAGLRALVERCLEKDPERRFRSAVELERALEALAAGNPRTSPLTPPANESPVRSNVVPRATSFIGRTSDLAAIEATFAGGARLVTLWGAGGTGKTRLATEHALARTRDEPGGVWFCDLTEARTLEDLAAGVAAAIGVPLAGGDPVALLGAALAARGRSLVVLDNLEQIVEPAAKALARWLALSRETRFLATSRELLGIEAERPLELLPLSTETAGDAERLFLERAQAARGSPVPASERDSVDEIVRRLDGMPLAIELAAARARVLSPRQLAGLLGNLDAIARTRRDASARHATLRAAIDWSWGLLTEAERSALAQASVFRGGFSLEAAEAVIDLAACEGGPWVGDALQALVEKSLVRAFDARGERRFGLYETIRDYAREKLGALGLDAAARHSAHFVAWGTELAAKVEVHGGVERLARLVTDRENLLAVLERALAGGDAPVALEAVLALGPVFEVRGPLALHVALLDRAIASGANADALLRTRALLARGRALMGVGRFPEVQADLRLALEVARARGNTVLECAALDGLAVVSLPLMQGQTAEPLFRRGLELARSTGDRSSEARLEHSLGLLAHNQGLEARPHLERALALYREVGARRSEATAVGMLGRDAIARGEPAQAVAFFESALALAREIGARWNEGRTLAYLAYALLGLGRDVESRELSERAQAISREIGDVEGDNTANSVFAELDVLSGDFARARSRLEPVAVLLGKIGHKPGEAGMLFRIASLELAAGDPGRTIELASRSLEIVRLVGDRAREVSVLGIRASALAQLDRVDEARADLEAADAIAPSIEPGQRLELTYHRGVLEVAQARAEPGSSADELRVRARARLAVPPVGLHARWAARFLERALAEQDPGARAKRPE